MACFIVPAVEAAVVTVVKYAAKKKAKKEGVEHNLSENETPFYEKLGWLSNLLWGGSALLAFEHLWHGEIVPIFPFLTAMKDAAETEVMLREMATVGVTMAILVTLVWVGMVAVSFFKSKSISKEMLNNSN